MVIKIRNAEVQIDSEDYERVNEYKWYRDNGGYAVWRGIIKGKKKTILMHRLITNAPKGMVVDHVNHDRLDNRKSNLHVCTSLENSLNMLNPGKGYYFDNKKKRWIVNSRRYSVKYVSVDTEEAAKLYVRALSKGETPKRQFTKQIMLKYSVKLTTEMMREIDSMFAQGHKRYQIALHFGLSNSAIGRYLSGQTWKPAQRSALAKRAAM